MAENKIISYDVELLSTNKRREFYIPEVYTNDLYSNEFQFNILDVPVGDLSGATARILLDMRDGSFFNNSDVTRSGNTFKYVLKANEGKHYGIAKVQLVVVIGDKDYATPLYNFAVMQGLDDKKANEVVINDLNSETRKEIAKLKSETNTIITDLSSQFQQVIDETTGKDVISAPEIIAARGTHDNLSERLLLTDQKVAENSQFLLDVQVSVRKFKNITNSWGNALQLAIDYASSIYGAQSEIGGLYAPRNVVVKMPRGRYEISEKINGGLGIDFDFEGVVFVANPSDKTIDFLDFETKIYRNTYYKGTFIGFRKVLIATTVNRDTSNFVWESPTFQSCECGIDTLSYKKSRSTFLKVTNMYSIRTDLVIKTHTDMCTIEGGWIYHSGYDGAAIYNQGYTKITDVVFVPTTPKVGAVVRWVDNHSNDEGATNIRGERGIFISHCRFGGEVGSMPVVFNYAENTTDQASYKATIIAIENSIINSASTENKSMIVLFKMPNRISIKNVTGMTNMTDSLIKVDSSLNISEVPYSPYISIEADKSAENYYGLMDKRLERFYVRGDNLNDMFRYSFEKGFYGRQKMTSTADGKPKYTFNINYGDRQKPNGQANNGIAFLLTVSSGPSSSYSYKGISTYIVHISTAFSGNKTSHLISYSPLKETGTGIQEVDEIKVESIHWGSEDTGSKALDVVTGGTSSEVTIVMNAGKPSTSGVSIVPLFGS